MKFATSIMKGIYRLFVNTVLLFVSYSATAQPEIKNDTLFGTADPVVITATRIPGKFSQSPLPVNVVTGREIRRTGLLRLQDILQEQPGIAIVNAPLGSSLNGMPNPFGQGVQIMGLDPAYSLILLDGEPLIGRNAGILNTGRIATGNIKQVEIVKGPASSLYGSEAMAGVINIITQLPESRQLDVQLFSGSQATSSSSISFANKYQKSSIQLFGHQYESGGYDLNPALWGNTQDPYRILAGNVKWVYEPDKKHQIILSARINSQTQNNRYQIQLQNQPEIVSGKTVDNDFTAFFQWRYQPGKRAQVFFRSFMNKYSNESMVNLEKTNVLFDAIHFRQNLIKQEIEYQLPWKEGRKLLALAGWSADRVEATRYANQPPLTTFFACLQQEWKLFSNQMSIHAGARLDKRVDFAGRVSPRLSLTLQLNQQWKVSASAGGGFKAPDFRHMYLNFSNAQIGYSLIGASALGDELLRMQQVGQLQPGADITPYLVTKNLLPEYGMGYHFKVSRNWKKGTIGGGLFYNQINQQIDLFTLPFSRNNGLPIYSYHNTGKIFTAGLEVDGRLQVSNHFSFNLSYQFLVAKDRKILEAIDGKKLFRRDPETFATSILNRSQYFGLPNRSRHIGQMKFLYENRQSGQMAYLRFIYRSAFGWADVNGNAVIDDSREMAEGFLLVNFSAMQRINHSIQLQGGIENLLDYKNPMYAPHLPGRQFTLSVFFQLNSKPTPQ